jgi:hypothetical protein
LVCYKITLSKNPLRPGLAHVFTQGITHVKAHVFTHVETLQFLDAQEKQSASYIWNERQTHATRR